MAEDKVLSVNNLAINFKTDNGILKAVRNISFDLNRGETLCIVGESGSGKSVTSKAIMGILANNAIIEDGNIMYRGENLLEVSEDEFYKIRGHKIGMIFQDPLSSLNPIVRIGKQITEAMLINSDKLKIMYQDLISDDLIRYKNTLAKMNIEIANERKKLDAFIAETKAKENVSSEQKAADKKAIQEKKAAFKEFEKKTRESYESKAKELKAVLEETQKKAKQQVKEYKEKVTAEHKARLVELEKKLESASATEESSVKAEIENEKLEYVNKLKLTKAEAKKRAIEIMREVGIPDPERRFKQYPFEFSGGMRQRIVIAIALTASPEILICDEPTTALDVTIQAQILELINRIKAERNLSCIFITHDLGVVANMADRVAVMYAGKIVEYGTAEEIFYDPRHPYTWALLSSIPDVDSKEKLEAIPGTPPNMIYPPKGDAFAARSRYAMNIDYREEPPMFKVSDTHYAATWLLDPHAPKVEMPKIVSERIRISLEEDKGDE
nr:oligopeptide/dipeptide ABC transporter ATP-binding protein [uncultured Acetatifactor sp.]